MGRCLRFRGFDEGHVGAVRKNGSEVELELSAFITLLPNRLTDTFKGTPVSASP